MLNRVWDVLIVDDLPQLAELVQKYVTLIDFECNLRWSSNLTKAEQEVKARPPHLILLDFHMPNDNWKPAPRLKQEFGEMTTLAFCKRVVTDPQYARVVVAMVSVDAQVEELSKQAGAHLFYKKYDFSVDVFEKVLGRMSTR